MKKLIAWFKGIFPLLQNMFLPALLTAATIVWFYAHDNISRPTLLTLHHLFYLLGFGIFIALLYFNQNKGLFFTLCLLIAYTLLNRLKYLSPDNFWETPAFLNLSVLLPVSLLIFYFLPEHKLLKRYNVHLLLGMLSIYSLGEQLSHHNISLSIENFETYGCLSSLGLLSFGLCLIAFYIRTVSSGQIMDYSLFFATILTGFGFYYASEPHALVLFFSLSLIIICLGLSEELYNDIYKDRLTGFGSRNAFVIQSKKFPLKYSVGIVRIDNYDNLKKAFGKKVVLDSLDLDIRKGESLVVIGGSGTGKSVLIKCIQGLLQPDAGSILIDDQEVVGLKESEKEEMHSKMGMLFQGGALFDSLSVWENVAFGLLENQKMNKKQAKNEAIRVLRQVGLAPDVADLAPSELSGGMQKRVGLARAIATRPEIIFFDEPTTGLDPIMADVINDLIIESVKGLGATALTITHDMASARKIADRIAMLYKGKIIWQGTVKEMDKTNDPYVCQFINGCSQGPIKVEV